MRPTGEREVAGSCISTSPCTNRIDRAYPWDVATFVGLVIALLLGVGIGVAAANWVSRRRRERLARELGIGVETRSLLLADIQRLLTGVPGAAVLVETGSGRVVVASSDSYAMGVVVGERIVVAQILAMVTAVHRTAGIREETIDIRRPPYASGRIELLARVAPVNESIALVIAEDISGARRIEDVRRDFVANVSHELKTPVGALSLLSEAILEGADEPDEVRHFAGRMQIESARLSHLVADLVDLSRLQGDDPMQYAHEVDIDSVLREAVDSMRTTAQAKHIELVVGGDRHAQVYGVESQLVTAVRNLVANAVSYSGERTQVSLGCRIAADHCEITVTDQGMGIPSAELDRVFERFYRVDQARSRDTGGTGLGLSIVKHVCQNHGGSVSVWSVEGEGSTFTLRLRTVGRSIPREQGELPQSATSSSDATEEASDAGAGPLGRRRARRGLFKHRDTMSSTTQIPTQQSEEEPVR